MPSDLKTAYEALDDAKKREIQSKFAALDTDVSVRVDQFLKAAVDRAEGWHPRHALSGFIQRRDGVADVFGLVAEVGSGALLYGLAQGAIIAAGVAGSAVTFGVMPAIAIGVGAVIWKTKAEIHHSRLTRKLKSGLINLKAARSARPAGGFQANSDDAAQFIAQFASVMHEAGEKLNRKYLRVARVGKHSYSRFVLKSGSFHSSWFSSADAGDLANARTLVQPSWQDSSKHESVQLAVLELHFYGTTVYQALEEYLDMLAQERTAHLQNMTALRAHIVRQMHLAGNHAGCKVSCGSMDPQELNRKCEDISRTVRAEYQAKHLAQTSRLASIDQSQTVTNQRFFEARRAELAGVNKDGLTGKSLTAHNRHVRRVEKKLQANEAAYAVAVDQMRQATDLISEYQATIIKLAASRTEVTSGAYFDHNIEAGAWQRPKLNAQELAQEVSNFKKEEKGFFRGLFEKGIDDPASLTTTTYGADLAGNFAGEAISDSVSVAGGSTGIGLGVGVGFTIDAIKDLYEGRQLVRRLNIGGRASREVWDTLKNSGMNEALADLAELGLTREKLPMLGQRVKHYVNKMAEIDQQIAKVQKQVPYTSIFSKDYHDNSIFRSCQDAIDAWHACCYKDKQYAKLETSALAFLGVMRTMQTNLESASHGAVVNSGKLFTEGVPPKKPSFYAEL